MFDPNTYKQRHDLRGSFDEWTRGLEFSWFLTLNLNAPASFRSARNILKEFDARLDRELLGARFHKRQEGRTFFIAVPEHEHSNFHYHLLLEILANGAWSRTDLAKLMFEAWRAAIPSGSIWLRGIHDGGAALYTAKDLLKYGHFNEFIISTEFHTR